MKRESWAGHPIRFVERSGEWWAAAQDVCEALGLRYVTKAMKSLKNVQQYNVCDLTNSQVSSRAREKGGHMSMTKLTRAEFIARAVADRRKNKLRGQKEAYWARSAHIDAERRKKR